MRTCARNRPGPAGDGLGVGRDGSIDWLCLPRFDSPACFARLLGTENHGYWRIAPAGAGPDGRGALPAADGAGAGPAGKAEVTRHYQGQTLILETEWRTATGTVRLIDFMPPRDGKSPMLTRIVEGVHGHVDIECELRIRLGYGQVLPWVRRIDGRIAAIAGPDSLWLDTPVAMSGGNLAHHASFRVAAGERVPFTLTWQPSYDRPPERADPFAELSSASRFWRDWVFRCTYDGPHKDAVVRSLITLKALTYAPTGGIVAAATTSLPEDIGGVRNWDYRYCWLRDATITLEALLRTGYTEEAAAWRAWLERAIAGDPKDVQIMYGVAGERRLDEWEAEWLPGYEGSAPVRIGNAAVGQRQLDVYGEVIDALSLGRAARISFDRHAWSLQRALRSFLEPGDPRVVSTVTAIQRDLVSGGLVRRYQLTVGQSEVDGLSGSEGAFLACSFWLVNALQRIGQEDEASQLFERLLGLRNDVGLLSEEYDPRYRRLVGNLPQAFSHVPLIQAALNLAAHQPDQCRRPEGRGTGGRGQR